MTQETKSTTTVAKYQIGLDENAMNLILTGLMQLKYTEVAPLISQLVEYKDSVDKITKPQEENGTNTKGNKKQSK